jgi:spermidine synthase
MAAAFEELDYQRTPLGELILRRRRSPSVPQEWVYEVKLDHEMLMSSSVNVSEQALARLALEGRSPRVSDVLVGGLGLGYTAAAALEYPGVRRVVVMELLAPVIAWHRDRLVPMAGKLLDDPRCVLVEDDFFQYVLRNAQTKQERYDVILVDIDHSPECWLHSRHADFYREAGIRALADCLQPDGVFGLWSASKPAPEFLERVRRVFPHCRSCEVPFFNPHMNETDSNWVVIAALEGDPSAGAAAR